MVQVDVVVVVGGGGGVGGHVHNIPFREKNFCTTLLGRR